jgi:hypothetical protein
MTVLRIGRLLSESERHARISNETAAPFDGESLRSAFAITDRHVLTACHCVRDCIANQSALWFRLRVDDPMGRKYVYLPMRVTNYDINFDAAVLALDPDRLPDAALTMAEARSILTDAIIPLHTDVRLNDAVQVMGFPQSGVGADSDTNHATVVELDLPLGEVTGVKVTGAAFGAISPVDPHGLSGGPVLSPAKEAANHPRAAVAVVRAIPRGTISQAALGASLIATRISNVTESLPEVGMAVRAASRSESSSVSYINEQNALAVSRQCAQTLRESVVVINDDPEMGELTGWPHFFGEALEKQRPTAVGTAYGLKMALVLGESDSRLDRSAIVETLWKMRLSDGGWSTRTGSGVGRPEIGALVLGALASVGFDRQRLAEASAIIEGELSPDTDPAGSTRTSVVCAVIRGLVRTRPRSSKLIQLRSALIDGAIDDPDHENLLCWAARLSQQPERSHIPSVPHTAIAIVSLARADRVLGTTGASRSALQQALRWLVAKGSLENQTEQIRRPMTAHHWDSATVRHFTAAWVARALLETSASDIVGAEKLLDDAVRMVWQSYQGGAWEWEDRDCPVWMTYQGACVLRDYAMRAWSKA